jgi:hypothetical protein
MIRDSAVGIATAYGWTIQTGFGVHSTSYPKGTGGKVAGA